LGIKELRNWRIKEFRIADGGLKKRVQSLSDNPSNACVCHSEPFGKLRINSAKNLMDSDTYYLEILRLAPQNDVVGQPAQRDF